MSSGSQQSKPTTYFSNGQALSSPPMSVRLQRWGESAMAFGALYLTSLFSLDPYRAAQNSPYSVQNRSASRTGTTHRAQPSASTSWNGGSSGGGGGSFGPRRVGRVDDIRAPECGSCR